MQIYGCNMWQNNNLQMQKNGLWTKSKMTTFSIIPISRTLFQILVSSIVRNHWHVSKVRSFFFFTSEKVGYLIRLPSKTTCFYAALHVFVCVRYLLTRFGNRLFLRVTDIENLSICSVLTVKYLYSVGGSDSCPEEHWFHKLHHRAQTAHAADPLTTSGGSDPQTSL